MRVVAGNAGKLPHFIIAQPQIKTLAQLRGANFGVISEHEGTTHVIPEIAKAAGLAAGDSDFARPAAGFSRHGGVCRRLRGILLWVSMIMGSRF